MTSITSLLERKPSIYKVKKTLCVCVGSPLILVLMIGHLIIINFSVVVVLYDHFVGPWVSLHNQDVGSQLDYGTKRNNHINAL